MIGRICMVRTYSAGVFLGTLKSREGKEVVLTDAIEIIPATEAAIASIAAVPVWKK